MLRFLPFSYLGQTEGLAGISKPVYEDGDSKSEKSGPMCYFDVCFDETPGLWDISKSQCNF